MTASRPASACTSAADGRRVPEDDLLPLYAPQHLVLCERQCALIPVEGVWAENARTLEGTHLHRKADAGPRETRGKLRITRAVPLRSLRLGLIGKADMVEWHRGADVAWRPFPVEYKRGRPKANRCDEVQVCAQALCLEEMLGVRIARAGPCEPSRPTRARGLKLVGLLAEDLVVVIAPHAGAWVETR